MNVQRLMDELHSTLEENGYQDRIVSIQHLRDLEEGIEGSRRRGLLNEELYQEYLSGLVFKPPDDLPEARSLIVVAVPQPQIRVIFTWQGESWPFTIPPTYPAYRETDERVGDILSSVLNPEGYRVSQAALPVKYLAVRSGLGEYGRNNICYVPGMGSFHRLVAFYTDFPCPEDSWREPQMTKSCQSCHVCIDSCPAGAITADRFLIHAERCLTFHNERRGEFPAWIGPSWHNCLVGCLHCQIACPQNVLFLEWIEGDQVFSEEETNLILECVPSDRLHLDTVKKLERLDLIEYLEVLPRNLRMLLRQKS